MQANAPMRIQVSTDTFAAIWVDRRAGENSEDAIIRRKFNVKPCQLMSIYVLTGSPPSPFVGFYDRRYELTFPEGSRFSATLRAPIIPPKRPPARGSSEHRRPLSQPEQVKQSHRSAGGRLGRLAVATRTAMFTRSATCVTE
jgi:hypothetical protein